jgi:hypothetical protein
VLEAGARAFVQHFGGCRRTSANWAHRGKTGVAAKSNLLPLAATCCSELYRQMTSADGETFHELLTPSEGLRFNLSANGIAVKLKG